MAFVTGLDFTRSVSLFSHLQNRGDELLLSAGRRLMKTVRSPFVLLVTCDRAEAIGEKAVPAEALERALSVSPISAAACRYSIGQDEAERHVFLLASGIISPLFGEDTVQGQIASAAECARLSGSSSPYLDKLLNMAVAFSKRMHTEHRLRVFDSTVITALRERLSQCRRVLIVGSGEAARAIASSLLPDHEVRMTLRDTEKTFLVPPGAAAVSYDDRMKEALASDAIVSASSGLYYTFTEEEASRLQRRLLFDLSSPPDLPPSSGALRIPDLGVEEPEKRRMERIVEAEAERELSAFRSWKERAREMPDISVQADAVAMEALRRLSGPVSSLSISDEDERMLREAVIDSVRKAYIAKTISRKMELSGN